MISKKFKHDVYELINEADKILCTEISEDYKMRINIVRDALCGRSIKALASEYHYSTRSIELWIKSADDKGYESLRPKKKTGRRTTIPVEKVNEIIIHTFPFEYADIHAMFWTGKTLSDVLSVLFPDASLSDRQCREYLRKFGYRKKVSEQYIYVYRALFRTNVANARRILQLVRDEESDDVIRRAYFTSVREYDNKKS